MGSSELDTRNIAVSMRKSVENLVISSQDAIGQSISQALNFSGVISQPPGSLGLQENRSVSRSPSPSLRNAENVISETDENEKEYPSTSLEAQLLDSSIHLLDSASVCDVPSYRSDKSSQLTSPKSAEGSGRSKKKSWYSSLYPTYKSRSDDFKRLFKDLPDDERLIVDYSCALQKDILAQGRLYASQNYLCFYANIFGWETSVALRWKDVTAITKEKTALVIPNAILVCTLTEKNFLTSFSGRDKAYLMLFRIWQNALMDQPITSKEIWQWVHSCYGEELGFGSDDEGYSRDTEEDKPPPAPSLHDDLLETSSMEAGSSHEGHERRRPLDSTPPPVSNGDRSGEAGEGGEYRSEEGGDAPPTDMSDSDSETDKHHKGGEPEKCSQPHDGKLLLRSQLRLNIDQLFTLVFTSSKMYLELLAARNTRDYVQASWQHDPQSGVKCRQISYTLGLTGVPIGPKEVYVTETQVMNKCSKPGMLYSIDIVSENAGIPYADYFTVEAHYCLQRLSESDTMLQIYGQVKYKKSLWPMVKSFLEKNAIAGLEEYIKMLESRLQAEAQGGAPAKRKGRRRRRALSSAAETSASVASIPPPLLGRPPSRAPAAPRPAPARPAAAPAALAWLLGILVLLLLINAVLYWKLYYAERPHNAFNIDDLQNKMSSLSGTQMADWSKLLERHTQRQRSQLVAWRDALDRAVAHLAQTEQALMNLLESIKPSLEQAQRDASEEHTGGHTEM